MDTRADIHTDKPRMIEPVTESEIVAVVRASFGHSARVLDCAPIGGGLFNASYRVRIADPEVDAVLRVAPTAVDRMLEYERTMMLAEPQIYRMIANAGVPVPRVLAVDGSHTVIPRDCIFVEYINSCGMHDPAVPQDARPALARDLGVYLARIHGIEGARFGRPMADGSIRGSDSWAEVFGGMLEEVTARSEEAGVISDADASTIRSLLQEHLPAFEAVTEPRLTHNDIWDPNILVRRNGDWRIAAIIDADRALFSDREFEAALWWSPDPEFYEGYGRLPDPSAEAVLRRRFYALYVYLWQAFAFKAQIWNPGSCRSFSRKAFQVLGEIRGDG